MTKQIVVVGASQAGMATATALRRYGFDGEIVLIGDEHHRPYTRPPLSKGLLTGSMDDSSVFISSHSDLDVRTGVAAVGLDTENRRVDLSDGDWIQFDGLVLATGARARRLSPESNQSEQTLRTLDDAVAIRNQLSTAETVAVAGAGFLGLEVASSAASLGKKVTVVDQFEPLQSKLGPIVAKVCVDAAVEQGIDLLVVPGGVELDASSTHSRLVSGSDGVTLAEADLVVTAAGDVPNVEWLKSSGLAVNGGLQIDMTCAAAPGIVGAGDLVGRLDSSGRVNRTPHWSSALNQADVAAATLLNCPLPTVTELRPLFFWTEIFGLHIRMSGSLPPTGKPEVVAGDLSARCALLVWPSRRDDIDGTAMSINHPISAPKLAKLARQRL